MILKSVEITDLLSVKGSVKLLLDKSVTVLLGSNDHGKSNLLKAIEHLNSDRPVTAEEVNWDAAGSPAIDFIFRMSDQEKTSWSRIIKALKIELAGFDKAPNEDEDQSATEETSKPPTSTAAAQKAANTRKRPTDEDGDEREQAVRAIVTSFPEEAIPDELSLSRRGINADLSLKGIDLDDLPSEIVEFLEAGIPRVEFFRSLTGNLQDSVSAAELNTEEFEFMQGLFFYAGLNPSEATPLFVQDDRTEREIQNASKVLDGNLRRLWGQGTQLHFSLAHRGGKIEFLADDPAVKARKARMSKRSDGVTQFFRTSILLHARRKKNRANSYLYLFDEPGVYLHPQGQKDLLQVFEQLGAESQIVYATHSLFMLNQNFPERHRLIYKDDEGTKIDQKPHRANWRLATDALGVFLTSSILFSSHVLFVEGDSDPLYLYELFRQLNRLGEIDVDTNRLGIMSFSDAQNLKFLLQVIKRDDNNIQAAVLVDGDESGTKMLEKTKSLCERLSVKRHQLEKGKSIEDYCIHDPAFITSVGKTLRDAKETSGEKVPTDLDATVKASWEERKRPLAEAKPTKAKDAERQDETSASSDKGDKKTEKPISVTTGRWFKDISQKIIADEASKVALARNYVLACRELDDAILKQGNLAPAKKLCQTIAEELGLPKMASQQVIEVAG